MIECFSNDFVAFRYSADDFFFLQSIKGLEYGRYLQEVVLALEEDKDFSKKLENVSAEDIKVSRLF